jgi:hypothetical protein
MKVEYILTITNSQHLIELVNDFETFFIIYKKIEF